MNTSQGALYFGAGIDTAQFRRDIDSMRRDILGLTQTTVQETKTMDSAFKNLSVGIAGYFSASALKGFVMELVNVRGEFQKTEIAFSTMLRSGDKARLLMGQMVDLAAKTPFSLQEVSAGAKQLLAFQIPANQVVDVLTRMGNIAAGLGVPLSRINLVYGQVKAKGKLMGDDLRQFTEAGIPMVAELAKKFNKTTAEISAMVSAGKIGFKDVQDVLFSMTNEGGMFFNLMEKQSASLSGKIANLGDSWDQMLNKIGESNEGILYGGIEGLTHLIEHYQEMFEIIKTLVMAYGAYKAAIIITASAQAFSNKTLATEIGYLSISQRMKLGRAIVTQRQTAATLLETQAERSSLSTKYATLQAEVASLAVKKQKAVALGIERAQALANARIQLSLAQTELRSLQVNGSARQILIATKNVEKAQNTVIATQESAAIARRAALTAGTKFYTAQKELETVATALSTASKNAETAAEIANAAAKSANTIATQRLTIAQTAQTIAMTAAARAASFLNATLFANPYALAAALLATLAYAVYKYSSALTQAEESQKRMNDDMKNQIPAITEQESKLKSLIKVIGDHKTSEEVRASALKQVQSLTNGRLGQLDAEAVKTGKATAMIKQYIEMLKLEAEAKRYVNELGRLDADVEDLKNNKGNFGLGDMWDDFTDFDSKFALNLKERKKERVERIVKDKEAEKKEIQKKLDDLAKKGVNISETPVNEEKLPDSKGGWAAKIKAQIEELEAAAENAPTQAAYLKIQARIKKLNDLLSPKKEKTDKRQVAEIFPFGSPKQIQQQIQLIDDAMAAVDKGMVKIRKLDKYGSDKDKKGNPYLTGEIVSLEEAGKRKEALDEKQKALQYKNFQERTDEAERQWNNYYKMAEFYGKVTADAQYKDLFNGSQSYLQYLEKEQQALSDKQAAGGILSEKDKNDLVFLQDKINSLNGTETALENFKREIDNAVKALPSLVDQLEFFDKAQDDAFKKEGSNNALFLKQKAYISELKKANIQAQKDQYIEFVKEESSFQQKKTDIQKKWDKIRADIVNSSMSDEDKKSYTNTAIKNEAREISSASFDAFKKTDLWVKAFGDLDKIGPKTLLKLKKGLQDFINSDKGKSLAPTELKETQNQIKKLDDLISSNNPYKAIGIAVDLYKQKRKELNEVEKKSGKGSDEYKAKLEETNKAFVNIVEITGAAAQATIAVVGTIGDAFGGLSDELKQTLAEVQQLIDGIVNTVAGYFSGNYGQMISGIVQIVGAMVKLLSGDKGRERQIKAWQRSVEDLKTAYGELQTQIERTAGEASLASNRGLVENLEEQKRILTQMRDEEQKKKKADQDKITSFNSQISQVDQQIQSVLDNFRKSITTTDFKDLSQSIADALIEAFGKGEDAANSFEKVVDDVMRNAVANALRIKILEPAVKTMVDSLYSSLGFGNGNSNANDDQIKSYENDIAELEKQIKFKEGQAYNPYLAKEVLALKEQKQKLLDLIGALKAQMAATPAGGSFDGLTLEEREKIKAMGEDAMKKYMEALKQYQDLFGESAENAQGLKGDIKGITEKTAGALEGQFNAVRINVVAIFQMMQKNHIVANAQTALLSQIEVNTRNLHQMRKDLAEMNSKIKPGLAGIP